MSKRKIRAIAILLMLGHHCTFDAGARTLIVIRPPSGKFEGVCGLSYVVLELHEGGVGTLKKCAFSFNVDEVGMYAFSWRYDAGKVLVTNLRLLSKWDSEVVVVKATWDGMALKTSVSGSDWKEEGTLFSEARITRAKKLIESAKPGGE